VLLSRQVVHGGRHAYPAVLHGGGQRRGGSGEGFTNEDKRALVHCILESCHSLPCHHDGGRDNDVGLSLIRLYI
jgi:hypothetical protein